ncbi:hypothetical protein BU25DRAFT_450155 [Macroventuria anomochaeta]|uniref:Uncharacterized protein n=1 Tax=Macroventuria anomochaeta TaxID=301207 RepID=A0ACB6RT15_9PLEO|nr:uncharacterized protein BU25DRAFT_450155 [Macroventuria anomochaeta]KAF2625036.1 hypothetical protein BU25DRAFT_450155 [Macroventuria anomochaeta]
MPSTRSKKPSAASAAAQEPPATLTTPTPTPNRKRKRPQKFDAGVNPTSKKSEKQPKSRLQKPKMKACTTRSKPAEAPQASQFAAAVQAEKILGAVSDRDSEDEEARIEELGDPNPEDEVEAASAAKPAAEPSADDFHPVASVRYRAAFEVAIDAVLAASDCSKGVRVRGIMMGDVWQWVDETVEDLQPCAVTVVNVAATVYPYNQHKGDRRQKVLQLKDEEVRAAKPPLLDDQLRQMQQLFLMRERQQMSSNSQSAAQPTAQSETPLPSSRPVWVDFDYEIPLKMHYHTLNFLEYSREYWNASAVDLIREQVVSQAKYDINALMSSSAGNGMEMPHWVSVFKLVPGNLIELRQRAPQWRKDYAGLNNDQKERVQQRLNRLRQCRERALQGGDDVELDQ